MDPAKKPKVTIIEAGSIYFFYRPKIEREVVTSEKDVQRFFLVLSPDNQDTYRLATIGHKELPLMGKKGSRYWGYINAATTNPKAIRDELSTSENIVEELGLQLKAHNENEFTADIFKDLMIDKTKRLMKPLFKGEWE